MADIFEDSASNGWKARAETLDGGASGRQIGGQHAELGYGSRCHLPPRGPLLISARSPLRVERFQRKSRCQPARIRTNSCTSSPKEEAAPDAPASGAGCRDSPGRKTIRIGGVAGRSRGGPVPTSRSAFAVSATSQAGKAVNVRP